MKRSIFCTCILAVSLACWIGCSPTVEIKEGDSPINEHAGHDHGHAGHDHAGHDHSGHDHADHDHSSHDQGDRDQGGHDHASMMKYNQVVAEFPGHRHAMEIAENHDTGIVSAYLTDAHFNVTRVDTQEIKLHFVVHGSPKSFTLIRVPHEAGKPATFSSGNTELRELICQGWKGQATAHVEIDGRPNSATLKKLDAPHDHGPEHGQEHKHDHEHSPGHDLGRELEKGLEHALEEGLEHALDHGHNHSHEGHSH